MRRRAWVRVGIVLASLLVCWGVVSPEPTCAAFNSKPSKGIAPESNAPSAQFLVTGVQITSLKSGGTNIHVATSERPKYRVFHLSGPPRLVVDLEGARRATPKTVYGAQSSVLKQVRIGQFHGEDPAIVRVVADLKGDPDADIHLAPDGLRIEVKPRGMKPATSPLLQEALAAPRAAHQMPAARPPQSQPPPPMPPQSPQSPPPPPTQPSPPPVAVPSGGALSSAAIFVQSPFDTHSQNQKLLDDLALRIALDLSYEKGKPDEVAWKTPGAFGVEESRLLIKRAGNGSYRTLELSFAPSPSGGYQLIVYGEEVTPASHAPNPDLAKARQVVNEETTRMRQMPPRPEKAPELSDLAYQTYHLSYVTADRAIALLKTLGYTTIEYNEQAGESIYEKIYNPIKLGTGKPPIIIKLIDSTKTSLMQPTSTGAVRPGVPQAMPGQQGMPGAQGFGAGTTGVPEIGGTFLEGMTAGGPEQRLLILYDKDDLQALQSLLNLLQDTIDVSAREIMIEALVIELNSNRLRQLGVNFETVQNNFDIASAGTDSSGNALSVFSFTKGSPHVATFNAQLQALLNTGQGEILSNPSVLVLDDRQARIQIGQQVPVQQSAVSVGTISQGFTYFPVGIVLNLRPRVNEDGSEITMQTETIVSSINQTATNAQKGCGGSSQNPCAPVVDNRQVQSFVRVSDNTPFIIGGLISTNDQKTMTGIPLLSEIPGLGALFRTTSVSKVKQEVIIVITPHVIPRQERYFSYVIPKDSSQFDRTNYRLFRNEYRIRGRDLFDLEFVYDSNVYKNLVKRVKEASEDHPQLKSQEPFQEVLKGGVPGEAVLVRRMLWEIIDHTHYAKYIDPSRIIYFQKDPTAPGGFKLAFLTQRMANLKDEKNALALTYEAHPVGTEQRPFVPPTAELSFPSLTEEGYPQLLFQGNDRNPDGTEKDWMVLLTKGQSKNPLKDYGIRVPPLELLQGVLVLSRVLELNRDTPLTLSNFQVGRQIIFPSQEELQQGYHLVDRRIAQLFYEVYNYYAVFEQEFNRETREMNTKLNQIAPSKGQ